MSSGLAVEEDNIKLAPFPDTNQIVLLWYLYPVLPIIKTILGETDQLNALERTTLKNVNHTSKFTVPMFAVTK
ncbi:hypothetical protein V6959_001105 [Vibrio parahaemolyticus]